MPLATPEIYRAMLDGAHDRGYALPAINVSSTETVNAALRGFAEAESDGIVQVSFGSGRFASGMLQDMALGARALGEFVELVAPRYPVNVALHTDHCQADKVDGFIRPLLELTRERRAAGRAPLFQSHMFDGSALPLDQNLEISAQLLSEMASLDVILEIEVGVVGGEEDGVRADAADDKLYSTPEDMLAVAETLGIGERGRYLLAASFGNVHGVYRFTNVHLRPELLAAGQAALREKHGEHARFDFVFHGGSGSAVEQIHEAIDNGVVKMNIDTDNQYAFTRPIADHVFTRYDEVLKVDGGVGSKKAYDLRVYLAEAEEDMAAEVAAACERLRSAGRTTA